MGTSTKQPTATAFTRTQEDWARFILTKLDTKINARELLLQERGVPVEDWDQDEELYDLYDEEMFFARYADEMKKQRNYLHEKYLGE